MQQKRDHEFSRLLSAMPVADSGMETRVVVAPTSSLKKGQVLDLILVVASNFCLFQYQVTVSFSVLSSADSCLDLDWCSGESSEVEASKDQRACQLSPQS